MKVIVAMSGGVDSSVTATMLKNKGYEVRGLFLDFFNSAKNAKEVKKIAEKIGIPLITVNASKEFKKKIIRYFLDELKKGNTPNPCVVCNKEIKFKILLEKMLDTKAYYIATGHYARIRALNSQLSNPCLAGRQIKSYSLFEARDKNKDQSYFLYRLGQKELSKILFPLGDYTKPEVRKMAKKFGLSVHNKEESQDICFIPKGGYEHFLRKMLRLKQGNICDLEGNVLGKHDGLPLYTIGQRKGIKLGGKGPYYVILKDFVKNRLIVGSESNLYIQEIRLKNINWTTGKPKFPFRTLVRIRYRSPLVCATINKDKLEFEKPQRAVTPGQSAVFYTKKGEVIGGGTII